MASELRKLVSKAKRRTIDKTIPSGEIDLDLTEIHPRIVCMGFPASGFKSFYRNPYSDVIRYLDYRYGEFYMVYNLCWEKEYQYSCDKFHGHVRSFPFKDHESCPLELIPSFVRDSLAFLEADSRNVVVIHCKAGKGRTGVFACCLLLSLEKNIFTSPTQVIEYYGNKRTFNGEGLTVPSQRRYVIYYAKLLAHYNGQIPINTITINLSRLQLTFSRESLHINKLIVCTYNPEKLEIIELKKKSSSSNSNHNNLNQFFITTTKQQNNAKNVVNYTVTFDKNAPLARIRGDVKILLLNSTQTVGVLSVNTLFLEHTYFANDIDKVCRHMKDNNEFIIEFDYSIVNTEEEINNGA